MKKQIKTKIKAWQFNLLQDWLNPRIIEESYVYYSHDLSDLLNDLFPSRLRWHWYLDKNVVNIYAGQNKKHAVFYASYLVTNLDTKT